MANQSRPKCITVRMGTDLHARLRRRAFLRGHSMEGTARGLLEALVAGRVGLMTAEGNVTGLDATGERPNASVIAENHDVAEFVQIQRLLSGA